jgi:hypothetical protein
MNNRNWVCFDCRSVVRREAYTKDIVVCSACRRPRVNLGYRIPIPAKTKAKDWELLRERFLASERAAERAERVRRQKRKRELEAEIERLESRPASEGRSQAVRRLRRQIRDL